MFASDVDSVGRTATTGNGVFIAVSGFGRRFCRVSERSSGCHWSRSFSFKRHQERREILCGNYVKEAIRSGNLSGVNAIPRKFGQRFRVGDTSPVNPVPISSCLVKKTTARIGSGEATNPLWDPGFRAKRPVFRSRATDIAESKRCVIGARPPREVFSVPSNVQRRCT